MGGCMCQKCLLCQVDLLSELHFTECSQIFISLKALKDMNKLASTYVIIAHFTESGDFFPKKGGGDTRAPFHLCLRWCFLKSESLNNKNSSPKNTHIQSSFSARAFKSSPKSHRSKYKQNIRPKRMTWKIPHRPCWQNKMALKSWRRY